jgi:hypothetical protein
MFPVFRYQILEMDGRAHNQTIGGGGFFFF